MGRQLVGTAASNQNDIVRLSDLNNLQLTAENFGTFGYLAGTVSAGSVAVTGHMVALRVFPVGADASFNVNGGPTIIARLNSGFDWTPRSIVMNPTINWVSGTFDYHIETA